MYMIDNVSNLSFIPTCPMRSRRYFRIAGITVCVESSLDFSAIQFKPELLSFAVAGPGEDNVTLRHYFEMPKLVDLDLGQEIYRRPPWVISNKNGLWYYRGLLTCREDEVPHKMAVFSDDYRFGVIFSPPRVRRIILNYGWQSLALLPTDQIWLAPLVACREALLLHSAAAIVNGRGFLFVGHSEAGKSTTVELLKTAAIGGATDKADGFPPFAAALPRKRQQISEPKRRGLELNILCDDRNIVRKWPDSWRVHGTWSHGSTADVSPADAPLQAIFLLEQSPSNKLIELSDHKLIWQRLLPTLVRAHVTAQWWNLELDILQQLITEIPCYVMRFDKSGAIVPQLERLTR